MWTCITPCRDNRLDSASAVVWRINLDLEDEQLSTLERTLSEAERVRAGRYRSRIDRSRFIARRGLLRAILGENLDAEPERLQIASSASGKPILTDHPDIRFNISHSGGIALLAIAQGAEVGVDIELSRSDFDPGALAARFFTPLEQDALGGSPEADRHRSYLTYWTCKEAYLKALGTGIGSILREFSVMMDYRGATASIRLAHGRTAPYKIDLLHPCEGYVAALATQQSP